MRLVEDLRALIGDYMDCDIQVNSIDQDVDLPFVYLEEGFSSTESLMNGNSCLTESSFICEVVSEDLGEAIDLGSVIRDALNGYKGDLTEDKYCHWIEVQDTGADYVPRTMGDYGRNVKALSIDITTSLEE